MSLSLSESKMAKIIWVFENFQNIGPDFQKKCFSLPNNDKIKFELSCFANKSFPMFDKNHTFFYLYLAASDKEVSTFRYHISILNANGDKCEKKEGEVTYVPKKQINFGALFQIYRDYLLDPTNQLIVDGKLKVYCEVEEILYKNSEPKTTEFQKTEVIPLYILSEDCQSLLETGKFSDASLIVGDKKLLVHKAILSARSKVFAAMFENDYEEKRQNIVKIIDISVEVCQLMLGYIYTGKIPKDMSEYAADLFVAADKYQLDHLKEVCEQYLSSKIDVPTSADTLLLADMHHAMDLKASCIEFIVKHGEKVIASEGWKALIKARPELGCLLFERIVKKS